MSRQLLAVVLAACATTPARVPPKAARAQPKTAPAELAALSPDTVLATIRSAYLGSVRRCYTHQLKRVRLATRITVSFTVDERGHAQDGVAASSAPALDACVTSLIARWQFPRPRDPAAFRLVLRLEPE